MRDWRDNLLSAPPPHTVGQCTDQYTNSILIAWLNRYQNKIFCIYILFRKKYFFFISNINTSVCISLSMAVTAISTVSAKQRSRVIKENLIKLRLHSVPQGAPFCWHAGTGCKSRGHPVGTTLPAIHSSHTGFKVSHLSMGIDLIKSVADGKLHLNFSITK